MGSVAAAVGRVGRSGRSGRGRTGRAGCRMQQGPGVEPGPCGRRRRQRAEVGGQTADGGARRRGPSAGRPVGPSPSARSVPAVSPISPCPVSPVAGRSARSTRSAGRSGGQPHWHEPPDWQPQPQPEPQPQEASRGRLLISAGWSVSRLCAGFGVTRGDSAMGPSFRADACANIACPVADIACLVSRGASTAHGGSRSGHRRSAMPPRRRSAAGRPADARRRARL